MFRAHVVFFVFFLSASGAGSLVVTVIHTAVATPISSANITRKKDLPGESQNTNLYHSFDPASNV